MTVRGAVADPSGIVSVSVGGYPAVLGPSGGFALGVPLADGPNVIPIRATDGAGNVSATTVTHQRSAPTAPGRPLKARARGLRVTTAGPRTLLRFRLDRGARRVTTRIWRRVSHPGAQPTWTPAGPLRLVARTAGARAVLLRSTRLRPDIYQVRVGVVSAGGVAVTVLRYRVFRAGGR